MQYVETLCGYAVCIYTYVHVHTHMYTCVQNRSIVIHLFLYVFAVCNIFVATGKTTSVSIHAVLYQLEDRDKEVRRLTYTYTLEL